MDAQDATDTDRVELTVVDQPPDRLGMDTELVRYLANADEGRLFTRRRHASTGSQVLRTAAMYRT
jgi:hypothetical protein